MTTKREYIEKAMLEAFGSLDAEGVAVDMFIDHKAREFDALQSSSTFSSEIPAYLLESVGAEALMPF